MNEIFPKGSAWMDGKFIKLSEAKIPILDWGFLRSDATYDVVHVWKGRFFQLEKLDKKNIRCYNNNKKHIRIADNPEKLKNPYVYRDNNERR